MHQAMTTAKAMAAAKRGRTEVEGREQSQDGGGRACASDLNVRDGSCAEMLRLSIIGLLFPRKAEETWRCGSVPARHRLGIVLGSRGSWLQQTRYGARAGRSGARRRRTPPARAWARCRSSRKACGGLEQPGRGEGAALVLSDNRNGAVGRDALAGAPMPCLPAYRRY